MARKRSTTFPVHPNRPRETILRLSLHDQLLGRLRAMVIEGELLPEAKIDEKDLCARFGVSRTPLREALKVLASEGLVTLIAHRGAPRSAWHPALNYWPQ